MSNATVSAVALALDTVPPVRALIYTRVSQDRAGGRSPEEQETEARGVCAREGWNVTDVLRDNVGASRHSKGRREAWAQVKTLVAAGAVDVLVTWEASRAQRDLSAYTELRDLCAKSGVRWSYSGNTYDFADHNDRFKTGLDALLAEREADEIAHRVRRAMRANAASGRPHGRRLFGYQRVYDRATGVLLGQEPHPEEADVVRSIFSEYLAGFGIRTIARHLNEKGIATSTGARWNDGQVRRLLVNPAYTARRVYRGEVVGEGDWPPLVEPDAFERVQARLQSKREGRSRQTKTARLLTGVARCGKCGGKMHALHAGKSRPRKDGTRRRYYECRDNFCCARDLDKLDAYVTVSLIEHIKRNDRMGVSHAGKDAPAAALWQRAEALRTQLDEAVEQFTSGGISASTLAKIESQLQPKIAEAEREARRLVVPLDIDVPTDVEGWWNRLEVDRRREVVGAFIAAVVVLPAKRGSRRFDPDAVRIEWRRV